MKVRSFRWDEDNLADAEANRSSTMKIDEPKTPFIQAIQENSDDSDSKFLIIRHIKEISTIGIQSLTLSENDAMSTSNSETSSDWETSDDDDDDDEVDKNGDFDELRRKHYNMRDALNACHEIPQSNSDCE
jgi:protein phosphatase inhibitor 2